MTRSKYIICLLISFFIIETEVYAQDSEINYGMTWYLKRSVAIDAARAQNKQILLFWGRTTCSICNGVKRRLSESPLKEIIKENYILWFSDCDIYKRDSPEVGRYISHITGLINLPLLCFIDINDVEVAYGMRTGNQNSDDLKRMLEEYVSNDYFADKADILNKVYVSGNKLVIKSESEDEVISIYTITGLLTTIFHKTGYYTTHDLPLYTKGVFIVAGSSGWAQKIFVR